MSLLKKIVLTAGVGFTALCMAGAWAIHKEHVDETTMSQKVFIGDDCFIIPAGYGAGLGGRVGNSEMALMMLRMVYPSLAPFREDGARKSSGYINPYENSGLVDVALQYKELNNVSDEEMFRRQTAYGYLKHDDIRPDRWDVYELNTGTLYVKDNNGHKTTIDCLSPMGSSLGYCTHIMPLWEKDEGKKFYDYALNITFSRKYIPQLVELEGAVRQKVQSWHRCSIPKVVFFPTVKSSPT
nr:hypothetical protein [Gluconobacter oxydans]